MLADDQFDFLLKDGIVIDGTGAPRKRANVAVKKDKIVAVGELKNATANRIIDANGRIIAPGFIDVHTHDDRALLSSPLMEMKVSQGVTSVIAGNCGISLAPLIAQNPPPPLDLIVEPGGRRYDSFGEFLAEIDKSPPAVNAAFLVGHSTLRIRIMDDVDRSADASEIKLMRALLEEGLSAGAIGFSTGLFYKPAAMASTKELIEMSASLERFKARYVTHMRDESDHVIRSLDESFRIGRESRSPVVISHHKIQGMHNFGRSTETLAYFDKHIAGCNHRGIAFDVYPYAASSTVLKKDSIKVAEKVLVTWSKAKPHFAGRELGKIAEELGCNIFEAAEILQPAGAVYFAMAEEDVQRILAHSSAMIGSDGLPHDEHPHPRLWGTFPRVLGHYSRDLKLFPLEEAIRRMTSFSAEQFGLNARGNIHPNAFADITIFDEKTVLDRATFDDPKRPATGIDFVMVNGTPVWEGGVPTGNRPGRALRHGGSSC